MVRKSLIYDNNVLIIEMGRYMIYMYRYIAS